MHIYKLGRWRWRPRGPDICPIGGGTTGEAPAGLAHLGYLWVNFSSKEACDMPATGRHVLGLFHPCGWEPWTATCQKRKLDSPPTPHAKILWRCITSCQCTSGHPPSPGKSQMFHAAVCPLTRPLAPRVSREEPTDGMTSRDKAPARLKKAPAT